MVMGRVVVPLLRCLQLKNDNSKVSIYMPTHNREDLVIRAVKSVLNQSYTNIELIVVDDGSDDQTFDLLKNIDDKRLFILKNAIPKGACYSRNLAIKHATGKFITGLDDDDFFEQNRIEILVNSFDEKYSFVCDNAVSYNQGNLIYEKTLDRTINLSRILESNVGNQVLTLRERLINVGLFDLSLPSSQDYDLWTRLIIKYGEAIQIPKHTYIYDISHDGQRISTSKRAIDGAKLYFEKYKNRMNSSQRVSHFIRFSKYGHLINSEQAALIFKERGFIELTKCFLRYVYLKKI